MEILSNYQLIQHGHDIHLSDGHEYQKMEKCQLIQ